MTSLSGFNQSSTYASSRLQGQLNPHLCTMHACPRTGLVRKQHAPEDLIRFWLGHADKTVTDRYSKLNEDVTFRKKVAEQVGIGFELPTEKLEVAPNCTQTMPLSTLP